MTDTPDAPPARPADSPTHPPIEVPSLGRRLATLATIVVPFLGLAAGIALCWEWAVGWVDLGLLAGMYALTAVGITVGFHRLLTHRSFEAHPAVRFVLAALGSMAVQGPLLRWVALHRRHHQHSDTPDDPHTPHHHGRGLPGLLRGFYHAHIGWAFGPAPAGLHRYAADLRRSAAMRAVSALFPVWVAVGLLAPAAAGGLLSWSWQGAALGLLWGGLVRIFLVHHVTWSVNSACHLWGTRPHPSGDHSRNNVVLGVLALGEGWHNNHHAFPTSARHGLRWWEIDASYWVIRGLALCGLAWDVKVPAKCRRDRTGVARTG